MKVCFDVNVIIDMLAQTDGLGDAVFSYDVAALRGFDAYVPASALADIAYILHRRGLPKADVATAMGYLFEMFDVVDVNGSDGRRALQNGMPDYEYAVIAESCARNGIDLIVTHNIRDFRDSPVAAMLPADFVETYRPAGYEYEEFML